jgi:hypothetical protein
MAIQIPPFAREKGAGGKMRRRQVIRILGESIVLIHNTITTITHNRKDAVLLCNKGDLALPDTYLRPIAG